MEDHDSKKIKAQIQQALVQSGQYEGYLLLDDGWIDKVQQMTREEMNKSDSTNFVEILNKVEPRALDMVNDQTKTEILELIKSFLNDIIE
ncbi:SAGA histone acetylase and TREX-2 complexes component, partial [Kluyveromyces marxianus]